MNKPINILVIEDDPVIVEFLRTGLGYEGYHVSSVDTGNSGLEMIRENSSDLVILDVMLPDIDGFAVCRHIRDICPDLPILMLTVRKDVSDRVKGLDSGADDYMTKPFSFDELIARIRVLLRRSGKLSNTKEIQTRHITLNIKTREVYIKNDRIDLTPTEFAILKLLMQYPKRVFTRDTLLNRVLGYDYDGGTNIIDVHISHLRRKLDNKRYHFIRTIHGVGYAFYPEE